MSLALFLDRVEVELQSLWQRHCQYTLFLGPLLLKIALLLPTDIANSSMHNDTRKENLEQEWRRVDDPLLFWLIMTNCCVWIRDSW
mmetsp:Transcript_33385/g.50342  ORF Transcript_33385/g.50342 Transcript_33385/m.50342 type:complete len:86 (-) Transcript_33385:74-331(-)